MILIFYDYYVLIDCKFIKVCFIIKFVSFIAVAKIYLLTWTVVNIAWFLHCQGACPKTVVKFNIAWVLRA